MRELHVEFPVPCGEPWESMTPAGCNRHCATCDKIIHDLEHHSFEAIEALVEGKDEICVRARVERDGTVALKPGGIAGRLVAAASLGLLAAGAPAAQPQGKIVGQIDTSYWGARIIATDAAGKTYRAGVRRDGRYWVKNLPPGDYTVTASSCDGDWTVGNVTVGRGEAMVPRASEPEDKVCIIVGVVAVRRPVG